ncbi:MAG TPA: hemerythrin domain-containing protein [Rhodocyclaceae bacterium]
MRRSEFLVELSREHHAALSLANRIARVQDGGAVAGLIKDAQERFARDIEPHFRREEQGLLLRLGEAGESSLVERTLEEHARLRELAARLAGGDRTALKAFGAALSEHVRFEERELFARAEEVLRGPR